MDYTVDNLQVESEVLCVSGVLGYAKAFIKSVEKEEDEDA